jgi:hypothetical protein
VKSSLGVAIHAVVPVLAASLVGSVASTQHPDEAARLPRLEVAANGRFLVREGGASFFWLADLKNPSTRYKTGTANGRSGPAHFFP